MEANFTHSTSWIRNIHLGYIYTLRYAKGRLGMFLEIIGEDSKDKSSKVWKNMTAFKYI